MNITREGPVKIGIKDIERAWRKRAKDARTSSRTASAPDSH